MIQAAQSHAHKGKAASNEAASLKNYASSVKVVAGVGFETYLTPPIRIPLLVP
jgi:hypothetical protein